MQLGKGGKGGSGNKQSPVVLIALIVVILAAGLFLAKQFMGGGSNVSDAPSTEAMMPEGTPPGPGGPGPGGPGPGGPPMPGTPDAPPEPPPAPGAAAPPAPAGPASPAASGGEMQSIKVFGAVTVNYPKGWKIDIASANTAAVFTNGKACFEIYPPDPMAKSAKDIADSALKTVVKGAQVISQSSGKVSGHDAYWYSVNKGGTTARVVGLDSPTRIVIVSYVKGGSYSAYQPVFDRMQESLGF